MKNFGDVFQLSQGSGERPASLRLFYVTSPAGNHSYAGRCGGPPSAISEFGGVKTQAMEYVIAIVVGVACLLVGMLLGWNRRKTTAEREIGSAEAEATRIVNEAYKSAESKKREALVETKEESLKAKNEYEREEKERRADLQKQERRLQQKEETLDRKTDNIEKKEEQLNHKLAKLESTQAEAEKLIAGNGRTLLRQSGTEPVIRVMVEAETPELCEQYAAMIADVIVERGHCVD